MLNRVADSSAVFAADRLFGAGRRPASQYRDHSNPQHLWNRLNQTLFERTARDREKYGLDDLDILYWYRTKHLLSGPSHQAALAILDEFINTHGEKLIHHPLKRALLQRDLWELFDWAAAPFPYYQAKFPDARHELESRLAVVIRRLALTTNEIASLQDNYVQAERDGLPDLPRDVFKTNDDWVSVGVNGYNSDPVAPLHVYGFNGHSAFSVMLHLPGGREATIEYLNRLREFARTGHALIYERNRLFRPFTNSPLETLELNPNIPQFPTNTEWALVRRMCVIDADGQIQATPLTESLQLRRYLQIKRILNPRDRTNVMQVAEFQMDKRQVGALRAVGKDETQFVGVHFRSMGIDPFEGSAGFRQQELDTCFTCHSQAGIFSVHSYTGFDSHPRSDRPVNLAPMDGRGQATATIDWKKQQDHWGLLQGLWETGN